ncbi:thioredoxin [Sporolactobacillus spathodeae]|uniref:Thioredoxin n=1 Tax=Sporolactobacillus spathodeae TaxID=1465502 RepID=A0ABS2Q8A1_9BACL|nr:thioredoxin [Sporolactobacillus spathodeae]MBM7658012.1 thioredoxin 1 [Sporolactobacillus spathodeae]
MAISQVNDANFAEETSKGIVVADFWATWCGPCKMMAPVLEDVDSELADKVKIVKLDVDENQATASKYGVMSIPTLFIFKDGEIADKVVGFTPKEALVARINQQLA